VVPKAGPRKRPRSRFERLMNESRRLCRGMVTKSIEKWYKSGVAKGRPSRSARLAKMASVSGSFFEVWPSPPCAGGSRCDAEPPPSCSARVSALPGILGCATASKPPPPSVACTAARCGRSGPVGCGIPPMPTRLGPRPGVGLPRPDFHSRPLARPNRSPRRAAHANLVG